MTISQSIILEKNLQFNEFRHPFLQELIKQIRLADSFCKYQDWSDELLIEQFTVTTNRRIVSSENNNFNFLKKLLTYAFYQAIGTTVERITGHKTETFVHLKSKDLNSAVIFCGGVLVFYSLILGYGNSSNFLSLKELIETSERSIQEAITKASLYLDFVY